MPEETQAITSSGAPDAATDVTPADIMQDTVIQAETIDLTTITPIVVNITPINKAADVVVAEEPAVAEVNVKPVPEAIIPSHLAFFYQYLEALAAGKSESAIKAFINSVKSMLRVGTDEAFDQLFTEFKNNKPPLKQVLQSAAILPRTDRATIEVIATVYHLLATRRDVKPSINLDTVRTAVKNEKFVNWCAKRIG